MANTLGYYNPVFYAQEALIQLEKALGMAARVHRGYDEERRSFAKGEYINIRRPSAMVVANAPATAADLATESVQLQLAYWREVKFKLTDKELAFTSSRIIDDHIRPAAYALADDIDQKLAALYLKIPWYYNLSGTPVVADITGPRKLMFDNKVPLDDPARSHFMISGAFEQALLGLSAFSQQQGAGDQGVNTQMRGSLGTKYGFEMFANQNVQSHTGGVCADAAGALTADTAIGDLSIAIDAVTVDGTIKIGDVIKITGDSQWYVATADVTFAGGAGTIATYPGQKQINLDNAVVDLIVGNKVENLMFHRNAFALAMAPLSEIGNELGAKIAAITDPTTGLSVRSRLYYVGDSSEVHVALDVLYGVITLDPQLAVRGRE